MKKLSKQTVDVIKRISDVGKIFNIGVFVIDKSGIRAKADESYIFLFQNEKFNFLEFDSLCINRVSEFNGRINFMEKVGGSSGFDIELGQTKTTDSGDTIVQKLRFITSGTAVEVGCADSAKYNFPRAINDKDFVSFSINNESIEALNGFPRIIHNKNKFLNIKGISGVIIATMDDVTGDAATHVLSNAPKFDDDASDFTFTYNINNLLPMLRGKLNVDILLTQRGVLMTTINDIEVIMFPEKLT